MNPSIPVWSMNGRLSDVLVADDVGTLDPERDPPTGDKDAVLSQNPVREEGREPGWLGNQAPPETIERFLREPLDAAMLKARVLG
jgi:hypothetical protein